MVNLYDATSVSHVLRVIRHFLLEETFKVHPLQVSEVSRANADKLTVIIYADHVHVEHPALSVSSIYDMPTFIMTMLAAQLMDTSSLVIGYDTHANVETLTDAPKKDLQVLENRTDWAPHYVSIRDIRSIHKRIHASAIIYKNEVLQQAHPLEYLNHKLQDSETDYLTSEGEH